MVLGAGPHGPAPDDFLGLSVADTMIGPKTLPRLGESALPKSAHENTI